MYSTSLTVAVDIDQSNIANPDFLRLIEEMNEKHLRYTLKRKNKPVAILLPVATNAPEGYSLTEQTTAFTFGDNVIDFNQEQNTDTVRKILSQPSDISSLLEMSGTIDDAEDVSSNKKKYIY